MSHPFVERLIGTIRREFLDHELNWNAVDLERKREEFQDLLQRKSRSLFAQPAGSLPGDRSGKPPPIHALAAPLPRSVPYADRGVIYEFAMNTPWRSNNSTSLAKSASERVRRSTL